MLPLVHEANTPTISFKSDFISNLVCEVTKSFTNDPRDEECYDLATFRVTRGALTKETRSRVERSVTLPRDG